MSVDYERVSSCFNRARETSICGVIFKEVGVGSCVGDVVDGDNFEIVWIEVKHRFQRLATNTAETVNAYTSCHAQNLLLCFQLGMCVGKLSQRASFPL